MFDKFFPDRYVASTYVIDFLEPKDELMGLMLVLAIDAANCTNN